MEPRFMVGQEVRLPWLENDYETRYHIMSVKWDEYQKCHVYKIQVAYDGKTWTKHYTKRHWRQ